MSDICPRCHNDRNYSHERDGTNMCWCGDVFSLHIKEADVDDLALALNRYLLLDSMEIGPRPLVCEILEEIRRWKKEHP